MSCVCGGDESKERVELDDIRGKSIYDVFVCKNCRMRWYKHIDGEKRNLRELGLILERRKHDKK